MFARADIGPLSAVAATGAACGILLAVWLGLPADLGQPAVRQEIQPISADDPNLVRYRQVMAEQGGPAPLFLVQPNALAQASAPRDWVDENRALEAEIAREEIAFQDRSRTWDAERAAWLEARGRTLPVQPGAYPPPGAIQAIEVRLDSAEAEAVERPAAVYAPAARGPADPSTAAQSLDVTR